MKRIPFLSKKSNDHEPLPQKNSVAVVPSENLLFRLVRRAKERFTQKADPAQRKAGRNILLFLTIMLLFTIIARGTSGAVLPKVTTVRAEEDEIVDAVTASGTVSSGNAKTLDAPGELTVKEVLAAVGQNLEEGDPVLRFDPAEVQDKLDRAKAALKELKAKLQSLEQEKPHNSSLVDSATKGLEWAKQDYNDAVKNGDASVSAAEQLLEDAKNWLSEAEDTLEGIPDDEENAQARKTAEAEVEQAKNAVSEAESGLATAKTTRDETVKQTQRAIGTAEQELNSAKQSDNESRQTETDTKNQNLAEAETVKLDISQKQQLIEELETLLQNGGTLKAVSGGTVLEVAEAGAKSGEAVLCKVSSSNGIFNAEVSLDKSEAAKLSTGSEVDLVTENDSAFASDVLQGTVSAIGDAREDGQVPVTVALPENKQWTQGQNIQVKFIKSRQSYANCVPSEAVRSDSGGNYVLVMREESTILGIQNILYAVPVIVQGSGNGITAVDGAIGWEDMIVSSSTKQISEGDRVRVEQS